MRIVSAVEVRAAIAHHVLGDEPDTVPLGEIDLHPHQRAGLARVVNLLDRHGGALLADEVGLGKTFVALAVARAARRPLVIAPAAVRESWSAAARQAAVDVRFVSVEQLSRGDGGTEATDFVIVDEAQYLRSRRTARFAAATRICRDAKVLLLSATPIQNRLDDLRNVISLFLGERARAMGSDELAAYIVRRVHRDVAAAPNLAIPRVLQPRWVRAANDTDCLDRLLSLPPPLPPLDGDDGGVLLTYTLARQWASSRAALRSALKRRLARARAMEDALLLGRLPTRSELMAWTYADDVQQLTFPEIAARAQVHEAERLLAQVRHHAEAVSELLTWLRATADPDPGRANVLHDLVRRHPGERVVAFSEYAHTVAAIYSALPPACRAAMLTHRGGRVAGGTLARRELVARFSPGAYARTPPSDRIDVLVTTDVLSEGVNLQEASVVVHLDLSWNPARLEQRVGRVRRIGAARDTVAVYMFAPPAPTERLLRMEQRLRVKLGVAARALGIAGTILPGLAGGEAAEAAEGSAPREERIASVLRSWRRRGLPCDQQPYAAAARSAREGAIACVRYDGAVWLVTIAGNHVSDSRVQLDELLHGIREGEAITDAEQFRPLIRSVEAWFRRRLVSHVVDLSELRVGRSRRQLIHRVDTIARRVARHEQPRLAPLMRAARSAATTTLSAGAERVLDALANAPMPDEAWLHAVGEFAAIHAGDRRASSPEILALLMLRAG